MQSACADKQPTMQQVAPLPSENICRVAVLPFVNDSGYDLGTTIVTRIFIAELIRAGNYMVLPEGDVRTVYRHLKIPPGGMPDVEQIQILGNQLDAQLIIVGDIVEMSESTIGRDNKTSLTLAMQLLDPKTGNLIWNTYHRRTGEQFRTFMHFGLVNTVTELTRHVSQEIIDQWFAVGGLKPCSE